MCGTGNPTARPARGPAPLPAGPPYRNRTARAVKFLGPREVAVSEVALAPPEDGEATIRTLYSGISTGSELLAYRGRVDPGTALDETIGSLGGTFAYPFSYGYSCVGVVESSRCDVDEGATVFAFHPHQDRFTAPARDLVLLPPSLPARTGVLLPMVETALQIALDSGDVEAKTVVITGLGTVGIFTALILAEAGASVIGSEPLGWRRRIASELGVHAVAPSQLADRCSEVTGGRGAPLVIEASGKPAVLDDCLGLCAHEGTVLVASWYGTQPVRIDLGGRFHRRRLTLRSTQVSTIPASLSQRWTRSTRREAALHLAGRLPLGHLATTEMPFEEAAAAYSMLDSSTEGVMHVTLRYQ